MVQTSRSPAKMDNYELQCTLEEMSVLGRLSLCLLTSGIKEAQTDKAEKRALSTSEKNFHSLKREAIALCVLREHTGGSETHKCFESEKIIECELILIKACWSATNRLRGDAPKSCCLQFILSFQMREYLVFN